MTDSELSRFNRYVSVDGDCWPWTGAVTHNGYGRFRVRTGTIRAHRWMWEHVNGPIPDGLLVCHTCDNPRCVNPAHLFIGTQKENLADRDTKGRGIDGIRNGRNKLTPDDVATIRAFVPVRYGDIARLARRLGVTSTTVLGIRNGRIWRQCAA